MPTIFLHGITVRQDRFLDLLESVRAGFNSAHHVQQVEGFYWGDRATSHRYRGASIPVLDQGARAIDARLESIEGSKQMSILLIDEPLLELDVLKDAEEFDPSGAGFLPIPPEVEQRNEVLAQHFDPVWRALAQSGRLASVMGRKASDADWQNMVHAAFDAAGRADRSLAIADLLDPLCRSLTASACRHVAAAEMTLDTSFAWSDAEGAIEAILEAELGGQRSFIGDKLKALAGGVTARSLTAAMRKGLRRRIMDWIALFVGDVLAYMGNRDTIQKQLDDTIELARSKGDTPLWLVGHSLGGVIAFDYCLRTKRKVERLITVGSQVGLFAELGVFASLEVNQEKQFCIPESVEKWLNIYDPDDILSFLARPVMDKVTDIEFDTCAPFPLSHSDYWRHESMYPQLVS